jgi:CDP-paratose 2-epimerase
VSAARAGRAILVTGSSGLIGSEVCQFFADQGYAVHGVDNNQRAVFFGAAGDTRWNQRRLETSLPTFHHHELDVRDRPGVLALLKAVKPAVIVHAAAQPSHDRAAAIPFDDFDTNAVGTLNLLEGARRACPEAPFVHMSTNKVYGDAPNRIALRELPTRWDYADPGYEHGIPETLTVDQSLHSLFGASKIAADVMVQEYGRYFGMPTCCLRGGCLTGPNHSGVELHGFLSYLVKCNLEGREYRIYGYKGKQVRDNIHSFDLVNAFWCVFQRPRSAEVYNIGGARHANCSMLEAIKMCEDLTGRPMNWSYVEDNRVGDHIWWIGDVRRFQSHYPEWRFTYDIRVMLAEIHDAMRQRTHSAVAVS